ncbi:uncharacterized protein BCR38DRAFT_356859 [Pseudomassariella vexata]|uniref:Capsule polysaccharide biosynthesis protein n=1 Tax=Pseudomassariella vexata TaxID=1141098 RepID=A0A1Y2D8K4_9PEZI|nr:uncharacterized protein BCR38DRAFT_356859 [Pseudomassariella vexata]ORY55504.1 hypothetical protein BCR38DRAFT_356859 [Pseudomassariella vexata]
MTDTHQPIVDSTIQSLADVKQQPFATWSTFWVAFTILFIIFNMKNMPAIWHVRILNSFRFVLRSQRPRVPLQPSHIFQPLITSSSAQLMEIDFNLHKSNSSYFADADIARSHLVCTLFAEGIATMRGGANAYTGSGQPIFGLALGAVSCSFRRELMPYEKYEMWTKILAWDEKWLYIVTHFVKKGAVRPGSHSLYPEQAGDDQDPRLDMEENVFDLEKNLFATALSKCVFKSGRKTVAPELMLRLSGLLPTRDEDKKDKYAATLRGIEIERLRGMEMAQILAARNQRPLEAEFTGSNRETLGRHSDGAGLLGLFGTGLNILRLRKTPIW